MGTPERPRRPWSSQAAFVTAFALLCAGFLVHFSVGPYGLFLGLHYLVAVWWRRPNRFAEAAWIGNVSAAVLAVWFAWSVAHYGAKTTFTATSAVSDSVKMTPAENAANIAKNVGNTLVPTILRKPGLIFGPPPPPEEPTTKPATTKPTDPPSPPATKPTPEEVDLATRQDLWQTDTAGKLRDFAFLTYQVSLPFGLGLAGLPIVLYLLYRAWTARGAGQNEREPSGSAAGPSDATTPHNASPPSVTTVAKPVRNFWLAFIPAIYVVGTAVYGGVDRFGVAHICLQPMILTGLCLAAGGVWTVSVRWRTAVFVGLLADAALGVFLQCALEHRLFALDPTVGRSAQGVPILVGQQVRPGPNVPSRAAQSNLSDKVSLFRAQQEIRPNDPRVGAVYWGDNFDGGLPVLMFLAGGTLAGLAFLGLVGVPRKRRAAVLVTSATAGRDKPKRRKAKR